MKAQLNYLGHSTESSLFRNGRVFTKRDSDGNDDAYTGVINERHMMDIGDGRTSNLDVQHQGFQMLSSPLQNPALDFFDNDHVVGRYYQECADIISQVTGAQKVFAFDHNVRWGPGKITNKRIQGGQQTQAPIHFVHGDYTLASAPQRLKYLCRPPGKNDTLRAVLPENKALLSSEFVTEILAHNSRFALLNVWRNISDIPVMRDPLALCSGYSAIPDDLVVFEIHYEDRVGENYFAKYSARHEWWYYPHVTKDEVILIKQWDTLGTIAETEGHLADSSDTNPEEHCTFSFHSAFSDSECPDDAPDRQSIEVRCVAFFE